MASEILNQKKIIDNGMVKVTSEKIKEYRNTSIRRIAAIVF